ncbi:gluconate:H+ symporter, GntP family [Nocardioides alpinus]|uniref:Gluconate:H+ symporter, GntP family n=2 Tax=Nocardioides alpinus TaxID=748909 RepID=A0A1I0VY61_9ACTN|nr:GntP family permease [Nocardioides alpinus]SFA80616.1 gluconate:H+ symporter, GntP family [Nocardioides alpinus]
MDTMTPVYGAGTLLLIAAIAVAALLVLIIVLRMHAFVALVLVSLCTAVAAGVPVADVPAISIAAFGSTLGSVALLVGLGVMIGRLLEVTGGAQVLADTLVSRFGEKRAPMALGVAALLFGLPIFFDAGLVVFLPIIFSVAKRFGGSVLMYALPAAGAFAAMHAIVPPHPGPVTAATELGASIGLTLLVGVVIAVLAWFVGVYLVTTAWLGKIYVPIDDSVLTGGREADGGDPPAFGHVLGILLLPLVLIGANTVLTTLRTNGTIAEEGGVADAFIFIGQTPVALLIALLVATYTLAIKRHSREEIEGLLNDSLGPICAIILITGAGGMFGGVLRYSGIGEALSDSLADLGLPLIVSAFVIATILRVAQGSATVALTTTAGLLSAGVAEADPSSLQLVALVLAIAAGATVLSHVNDSGFWLVSRFFGMDVKTTLKTWTVLETTLGVTIFVLALGVWAVG